MRYNQAGDERGSTMFVQSVERAFAVLRAFDGGRVSMGLSEIAQSAGITKSAAQRFIHTLEALGYLRQDPASRRWQLTPRTLDIGAAYLTTDPLIEKANPHLVDLNHACGESVNLSEPDGREMVFLARFTSHSRTFVHMPVGTRIPMVCTASGRAYLSTLPRDEAERIVRAAPLHPFTTHTPTDPEAVLALVDETRRNGFATAAEEFYLGDLNIAAPLLSPDGTGIGAINISGPVSRWTIEKMKTELAPLLLQTARSISGGPSAKTRQENKR